MPAIIAFGRRWLSDTDDLVFMGTFDSIAYFPWAMWSILKVCSWLFFSERPFSGSSIFQDIALTSFFSSITLQWVLAVGFTCFGIRGTMSQRIEARLPCVMLFRIKVIMILFGPLWLVFSAYLFHKGDFSSDVNMKQELMVATAFQSIVTMIQLPLFWLLIDTEGSLNENNAKKGTAQTRAFLVSSRRSMAPRWKLRIYSIIYSFVTPWEASKNAITSAYDILVYIPHDARILFTDFFAGVMMVQRKQKRYYLKEELKLNSQPAIILSDDSPVSHFPTADMPAWMNLYLAKRYFHTGASAFGLSWTRYQNIVCGFKRLWNYLLCCLLFRKQYERDDCCRANVTGIEFNGSFPYKDFIHVSFQNKVYFIPFLVSVDVDSSAVLITVGGTMSANEVLTDVAAGSSCEIYAGCIQGIKCHSGMLQAARRIKERLEETGILEAAIEDHANYHLVTTGQNLGASVAALLAVLLHPSHPTVRCFAFEPLPCVGVEDLKSTFDLVFSIVLGNDVIPYLGFRNVESMVREIMRSAEECDLPKYKVFLWRPLEDIGDEDSDLHKTKAYGKVLPRICIESDETTTEETEENGSVEAEKKLSQEAKVSEEYDEEVEKDIVCKKTMLKPTDETTLFLPGRVLHIRSSKNGYRLQICTAEDFQTPMIRPGMAIHHSPQYIEGCLEQLGRSYTLLSTNL